MRTRSAPVTKDIKEIRQRINVQPFKLFRSNMLSSLTAGKLPCHGDENSILTQRYSIAHVIQKLRSCNLMSLEQATFICAQTSSCAWQSIKGKCCFPFVLASMIYREGCLSPEIKVMFATRHLAHREEGNGRARKITIFFMHCLDAFLSWFINLYFSSGLTVGDFKR